MLKTVWKSQSEINYSLKNSLRVAILGCNGCAEQCGTGGEAGVSKLKLLLEKEGKEVMLAGIVEECCDENLMRQSLTDTATDISNSDALVIVSCSAGVKADYLCARDLMLVAVLDMLGGAVFTQQDNSITRSLCKVCGQCVLTYTAGICPVTACPAKMRQKPAHVAM